MYIKKIIISGVTDIIANLTPERLTAVVEESYMGREVVVEIPKFTVERSLPLKEVSTELLRITKYIEYYYVLFLQF